MTNKVLIEVVNGCKSFQKGQWALKDVHLKIYPGESVALLGASGSGKSTLLRALCGLETLGQRSAVMLDGKTLQSDGRIESDARKTRRMTAIIFQQFNLVGRKSLLDNVLTGGLSELPLWRAILGWYQSAQRTRALRALQSVGLIHLYAQRASTLSGGQQQRAAIARALMQGSQILLADEPVASLDPESTERVMQLLQEMNRAQGLTMVVSLHDVDLARRYCSRVVALKQGQVVFDGPSGDLTKELLHQLYGPQTATLLTHGNQSPMRTSTECILALNATLPNAA